jgi:hypothetical protein
MEDRSLSCTKPLTVAAALIAVISMPAAADAQRPAPFFWDVPGWGESAARIQVTPRDTEVYVDGYHAGIVDDFDGFAQRLRVAPGEHVIELYLDGHRPVAYTILFHPGETYRIRHVMEPLTAGEPEPARPAARAAAGSRPPAPIYDALGRPIGPMSGPAPGVAGGAIAIRVQPGDAVVLVDGERWHSSGGERLEIRVSPGFHRIEVQKDGYQPFSTSINVRPGETATVNVSLTPSGGS